MSILVNKHSRIIVQGFTGTEGTFHAEQMKSSAFHLRRSDRLLIVAVSLLLPIFSVPAATFVNFETAPVHPVALSADHRTLAVCNLPDNRVELFDVESGSPVPIGDVPVGLDPVAVRFRTTNELWVINHISSSVSIVDLARRTVIAWARWPARRMSSLPVRRNGLSCPARERMR